MTSQLLTTTQQTAGLAANVSARLLETIVAAGPDYGRVTPETPSHILLEYVSADLSGPISLGHARGGVLGDTLASLLTVAGHTVTRECYLNDTTNSKQLDHFARVLLHRYRALLYESGAEAGPVGAPSVASDYPEEYIEDIARALIEDSGDSYLFLPEAMALSEVQKAIVRLVQKGQAAALDRLNVRFDNWFSESRLHQRGAVAQVLDRLKESGHTYERSGALWLRSTSFGDESDRTLVRPDGSPTYLAGDLAYHADKFERGADRLIDIWNAEHETYVARTRAGLAALGYDPDRLTILLHGPVRLLKDGTEVRGTPLSGPDGGISLSETLAEVPPDLLRPMLLKRAASVPLDLNLDLARTADRGNPTVYLRRALASCHAPLKDQAVTQDISVLTDQLAAYSETVQEAAETLRPDRMLEYALGVADCWNDARDGGAFPLLAEATAVVLTNALEVLGIPPTMDVVE